MYEGKNGEGAQGVGAGSSGSKSVHEGQNGQIKVGKCKRKNHQDETC